MKPESDYWVITKVVATDRVSVADIGEPFGVVGRTVYCKRKVEFVPLVDLEHYHPGAQSSQSPPEPPETPSDEPVATGATGSGPEPAEAFWDSQDVGEALAPDEGLSENHRFDEQGNPAGGETHGIGLNIFWQDGPLRFRNWEPVRVSELKAGDRIRIEKDLDHLQQAPVATVVARYPWKDGKEVLSLKARGARWRRLATSEETFDVEVPPTRPRTGAFVEDVIDAAIERLRFYQDSSFACGHNQVALDHLVAAAQALSERTAESEARGVEGTYQL